MDQIEFSRTYYPSVVEFEDPMKYLSLIKEEAKGYGIIKIVPPKNWKPPFCIDFDKNIVDCRIQDLSDIEGTTRVRNMFFHNITTFMEALPIQASVPVIDGSQIDLFKLFKLVESVGGYVKYENDNKFWKDMLLKFKIQNQNFYTSIKSIYRKILLPFSEIMKIFKETDFAKKEEDEKKSRKRKSQHCVYCGSGDDINLSCKSCNSFFHTDCIPHFMNYYAQPKKFVCVDCLLLALNDDYQDNQYAFEMSDSKKYTLNEFKDLSDQFYREQFGDVVLSPSEMESQYWNILKNSEDKVDARYGADLASSVVGSGFPTTKLEDLSDRDYDYHTSPWNLNNLPNHPDSITSFIKNNISGIKIPWVYVGSCLSSFCWHVEDHWSCSINYNHIGAIKTWYGIPSSDAEKFDVLTRRLFPELFEGQTDLMHHLVTTLSPKILLKNNIRVFKVYQNAGEFVVTFSRAYHAGFNQGFNCAEAVNFCFDDWIPSARSALNAYKIDKRIPVFSHEELVLDIAQMLLKEENKVYTKNNIVLLKSIFEDIKLMLNAVEQVKLEVKDVLEEVDNKNIDENFCEYCKTICYFATIRCSNHVEIKGCVDHVKDICSCDSLNKKLIFHIPLETVKDSVNKIGLLLN